MLKNLNRFVVFIIIGGLVYLVIAIGLLYSRYGNLQKNSSNTLDAITINILTDTVFFLLVGAVGFAAQFFGEKGDVLRERLRKVFATKKVSYPVLEYFEGVMRDNAVFAENASHTVEVLEFNPELKAYRAAFKNTYTLRNAFGDVPYDAEISLEIEPDMKDPSIEPLAMLSSLKLVKDGNDKEIIANPRPIGVSGFKHPVAISLKPQEAAILEMAWWSWVSTTGRSGFSLKRFSERFTVEISNKAHVNIQIVLPNEVQPITISYDEQQTIFTVNNLAPRTRVEFGWCPPVLGPKAEKSTEPIVATTVSPLVFDRVHGSPVNSSL